MKAQYAFEELEKYLNFIPLLSKPMPDKEPFPYLAISLVAISFVLVREEGKSQKLVYYISKVLHEVKTRYMRLEKFIFTLIIYAWKLQPFFQAFSIILLMNQPMMAILHHPNTLGRIAKWALELSKFDVSFRSRPSIKAQVLRDFVLECTIPEEGRVQEEGISSWVDPKE